MESYVSLINGAGRPSPRAFANRSCRKCTFESSPQKNLHMGDNGLALLSSASCLVVPGPALWLPIHPWMGALAIRSRRQSAFESITFN